MGIDSIKSYLNKPVSIAPLIFLRGAFAFMMIFSLLRFASKGWINELYIKPSYFFSYFGFDWLPHFGGAAVVFIFCITLLAAIGIFLGAFYRISSILFFIGFTYLELIDKANYLNHYYFISLLALLLILLPANRAFSLDVKQGRTEARGQVTNWTILILKVCIGGLYFMAGIAKLNYDWLFQAMPMKMWLPPHSSLPIIGSLLDEVWVAYLFSWIGMLYDIAIPFLLFNRSTRIPAYITVVIFHGLTAILFPIGMFPYIMMCCSLIFFTPAFLEKVVTLKGRFKMIDEDLRSKMYQYSKTQIRIIRPVLFVLLILIFIFPLRFIAYGGNSHWHEQGYRFAWRVMLMEKAGKTFFYVKDPDQKGEIEIDNTKYLSPNQEKQMSTQPDMILQFAHHLEQQYINEGIADPIVRAEAWVSINGEGSRLLIDPAVDLTKEQDGWKRKDWILPYDSVVTLQEYQEFKKNRKR